MALVRKDIREIVFRHSRGTKLGGITQGGSLEASWGYLPAKPERNLRVLQCYNLVYLFEGSGRYYDAVGRNLPLRAGDLILLFPRVGACYGPGPDERWSEFYVQFQGPLFDQWRRSGLLDPARPILHLEPVSLWLRRLKDVLGAEAEPGVEGSVIEICRLQLLLAEALLHGTKPTERKADLAWTNKACALLAAFASPELDLSAVAKELGISVDGFRKRFARRMGVPPGQYRTRLIIDRACELLLEGNLTNRSVAQRLGFSDEFHFSRRFKQVTGVTPTEFRHRLPRGGPH